MLDAVRVMPVVVIDRVAHGVPLAQTLVEAGIPAIEVTLRSAAALEAVAEIAAAVPDIMVGVGSIRRSQQLQEAVKAGARFAVGPGSTDALLDTADDLALPFVPGAITASEMIRLLERGYTLQKFFPAEPAGGLAMIKALHAPLPEVRFFPTGGISVELAPAYLAHPAVACVGGSWFVPAAALAEEDFARIGRLAAEAALLGAEAAAPGA